MEVEDALFSLLVLMVGVGIHQVVLRGHSKAFEERLLTRSFVAHICAGIGLNLVYTYYYGGGDMFLYHQLGVPLADALRYDFVGVFPELTNLFLHRDFSLPLEVAGAGSTGTMQAVATVLLFLLGNSRWAAALLISVFSYVAKVLIYRAVRAEFPAQTHDKVLFATCLSPTGVVWTCALLKEPVLMVFFAPAFLGLRWMLEGRRIAGAAVLLLIGGTGIVLLKPYVLIALTLGGAVWILWARTLRTSGSVAIKPLYLAVAIGVLMTGFTVISTFVPSMSPDKVAESIQRQRRVSAMEQGGSNFYLEGPDAPADEAPSGGLVTQLAIMPLALITALFRPFIFESFSAMQFLNAIEMTWLMWMFIQVVRRNSIAGLVKRITANPALMFCLVFVLVLALGTGLSTANLGTLSRYRAPMMPFFLLLLLVLREPETVEVKAEAPPLKAARASG